MNYTKSKGGVFTRRAVLGAGAAMIAAAGLSTTLAQRSYAATPKRGGTLRVGYSRGGTTDSLDPISYTSDPHYATGWLLGNNLVELLPDKSPVPELAESWEGSNGAKTWKFSLRKDVEFTNGKALVASDVVYSIMRHLAPDSKSAAKGYLEGITEVRADGDHVVIVEHATGNADIPVILADFHLQIVPEGFNDWSTFIGTGPYILDKFDPGVKLTAHRNPNYWKADRAWFDQVEFLFINDETARTNALSTGSVDAVDRIDPKVAHLLQRNNALKIIETTGGSYISTCMDVRQGPYSDLHVREAIKYGIDRQALVDKVLLGRGEIGNDHPVPSNDPAFNKSLAQRAYDPEKAKWHLKQAGISSLDIELSAANAAFPGAVDAAVLMREQGKSSGINLTVKQEPDDGYYSNVWMKRPYFATDWGVRATVGMMFTLAFQCEAPWNESGWCDNRFNELLEKSKTELDENTRRQMYQEMQELVSTQGGNVIFAFPALLDGYTTKVAGVEPDLVRSMAGARLAERAWFND